MAFGTFLNNLFGKSDETTKHAPPAQPAPSPAPVAALSQRSDAMDRHAADSILHREEILDRRNRLCGYRFTLKPGGDPPRNPEPLFFQALKGAGIPAFAQRRMAIIPISPDSLRHGDHRTLLAHNAVFLLDLRNTALPVSGWLELLEIIRADGALSGLTGVSLKEEEIPLLQAASHVLLDLEEHALPQFTELLRHIRSAAPGARLVADGVQSWAEQRMCLSWDFEFCMGGFLSTPDEEEKEDRLDQSRLIVIEMLNLLSSDADLEELGAVAKKDPAIAFQLLALSNSAAAGLSSKVSSLEQAMMVLGRARIYRWLTVSMFRVGATRNRDEALLEVALTRARFLETVAEANLPRHGCDELFLVGLISLFDLLLAAPMNRILAKMQLAPAVADALLRSEGIYAPYLGLALALEKGRTAQAARQAQDLGIDPEILESTSEGAFAWAQEALGYGQTAG